MMFINIKDPKKREEETLRYLALKKNVQDRDRAHKMGEIARQEELSKIFRPIIESSKNIWGKIEKKIGEIPHSIQALPGRIAQALPAPGFPGVPGFPGAPPQPIEGEEKAEGGEEIKSLIPGDPELSEYLFNVHQAKTKKFKEPIFEQILNLDFSSSGDYKLNINKEPLKVDKKNINFMGVDYERTPELMDLIFSLNPKKERINEPRAYKNYKNILLRSNVLHRKGNPEEKNPNDTIKTRQPEKWRSLLSRIWQEGKRERDQKERERREEERRRGIEQRRSPLRNPLRKPRDSTPAPGPETGAIPKTTTGKGIRKKTRVVFLSSDPVALADRLALLCGSKQAGNTGLRNEIVEICDELIRKRVMTRTQRNALLNDISYHRLFRERERERERNRSTFHLISLSIKLKVFM